MHQILGIISIIIVSLHYSIYNFIFVIIIWEKLVFHILSSFISTKSKYSNDEIRWKTILTFGKGLCNWNISGVPPVLPKNVHIYIFLGSVTVLSRSSQLYSNAKMGLEYNCPILIPVSGYFQMQNLEVSIIHFNCMRFWLVYNNNNYFFGGGK